MAVQRWREHLLSPQRYLHCLSLVLHLPLKQRPCRGGKSCYTSSPVRRCRFEDAKQIAHLVFLTCVAIHLVHVGRALRDKKAKGASRWKITHLKVGDRLRKVGLTWLELPVQLSWMSQSFTASLHTTPRNSICSDNI